MQNSAWYHVCWVTGTQFSLSPHTSTSCSMSESHLESWRQLVCLKRFFFSLISWDFLTFCTAWFLETLLRNFTQQWVSPSLKAYHFCGWGEKNSHQPFLTWAPLLVHPFTQNTLHVVVLLLLWPLTAPDLEGETSLLCAWSFQSKTSLLIWTVTPASLMLRTSPRFLHIKQF